MIDTLDTLVLILNLNPNHWCATGGLVGAE